MTRGKKKGKYVSDVMRWIFFQVSSPEFQNQNDFAAVVQPFLVDTEFPTVITNNGLETDMRYLSHDCFHPSQLGHAKGWFFFIILFCGPIFYRFVIFFFFLAANALWNNILEPPGKKTTTWDLEFMKLKCPTEKRPFIPVRWCGMHFKWRTGRS